VSTLVLLRVQTTRPPGSYTTGSVFGYDSCVPCTVLSVCGSIVQNDPVYFKLLVVGPRQLLAKERFIGWAYIVVVTAA